MRFGGGQGLVDGQTREQLAAMTTGPVSRTWAAKAMAVSRCGTPRKVERRCASHGGDVDAILTPA
jgi:hypothetical protein